MTRQGSQRTVEQLVDIPVPGRSFGFGGLQGFHSGQSSTADAEQNFSTPVPRRGGPRGGLQDFSLDRGSAATLPVPLGDAGEGFFALFPHPK